jgi:hypothetical protein
MKSRFQSFFFHKSKLYRYSSVLAFFGQAKDGASNGKGGGVAGKSGGKEAGARWGSAG